MKQTIRMNEAELNRLISESVMRVLNEGMNEETDEGTGNQLVQGVKGFFGKNGNQDKVSKPEFGSPNYKGFNLKKRMQAAKTGYNGQKTIDNNNDLIQRLEQFCEQNGVSMETTIGDLIGNNRSNNKTLRGQNTQAGINMTRAAQRIHK